MSAEYVESRNGGYYVKGMRVSLDSIVSSFKEGESPETIRQNFPSLTLEQVYGAITFYLAHQADVDANIREGEDLKSGRRNGRQAQADIDGFAVLQGNGGPRPRIRQTSNPWPCRFRRRKRSASMCLHVPKVLTAKSGHKQ